MTYNYKDTALPMTRIREALIERRDEGMSYEELALACATRPATISKWIKHGPDLKWYSLVDVCLGLDISLTEILKDTRWESVL